MKLIQDIINIANMLDQMGLRKEADALDDAASSISMQGLTEDLESDELSLSIEKYIKEGMSVELALEKAVEEFELRE